MPRLCPIALLLLALRAGVALAGAPTAAEVCPRYMARHPGAELRPLYQAPGGEVLFFGRDPAGAELLLQTTPTALPGPPPGCVPWPVGEAVASVRAPLVLGADPHQTVTLHLSEPGGGLGVVVARDVLGAVIAAGPFYLFAPVRELERLDLGAVGTFVIMRAERPEARVVDASGVAWHDLGAHLLAARDGLVREVGKSVALVPHWRDGEGHACHAAPPVAPVVLEADGEARLRMLDAPDVPGWGGRLLRGEPFDARLLAYTWRWSEELAVFLVAPPMRHEDVTWQVGPACAVGR